MSVVVALLAVVIALLVFLVAGLLRSHAELLRRLDALESAHESAQESGGAGHRDAAAAASTGRPASDLAGSDPDGSPIAVAVRHSGHDTLLLFLSTGCLTCRPFWEATADPQLPASTRLVVVTGDDDESVAPSHVTVVRSTAAWQDYDVPGSPYVVLVRGGQVVGEGTGTSWEQVRALLAQASRDVAYLGHEGARSRTGRDTDAELLAAGILPGDPRLHPPPLEEA